MRVFNDDEQAFELVKVVYKKRSEQNSRVGKTYSKCNSLKLCSPTDLFAEIEQCSICNKIL